MAECIACPQCGFVQHSTQEGLCASCLLEAGLADSGVFHLGHDKSFAVTSAHGNSPGMKKSRGSLDLPEQPTTSGIKAPEYGPDVTRTLAGADTEKGPPEKNATEPSTDELSL